MENKSKLEEETDENLLSMYANNQNKEALDTLFGRHMASAYHIAFKFMRNQADAEDVVQKAFINIMRFANKQNQPGLVKAWIMNTVINMSKNEIRHLVRQRNLLKSKPPPELDNSLPHTDDSRLLKAQLTSALDQLPDHYRWPIWLSYYENMSVIEVSHSLGKSENTIRSQLARGLEKLEYILKGQGVRISSMNIIALLAEFKKFEETPFTLINKIKLISNLTNSTRMSVVATKQTSNALWYLISLIAVISTGLFGYNWWQKNIQENQNNSSSSKALEVNKESLKNESNSFERFNLQWNFNSEKLPDWCGIEAGNYKLQRNEPKNDYYLSVLDKNDFLMKLNIPHQNKAFKVSFDVKLIPISNANYTIHTLSSFNKRNSVTYSFNNIILPNKWNHYEIIVQENIEALYINGTLMVVIGYPFKFDSSHYIHLEGTVANLDNIQIRNLEKNELKDFSKCIELSKQFLEISGENRRKIPSPLPDVKKEDILVYWGKLE